MPTEFVKTISPTTVIRGPYFVICEKCGDLVEAANVPYCESWGEAHVRRTGHTVVVEKRETVVKGRADRRA